MITKNKVFVHCSVSKLITMELPLLNFELIYLQLLYRHFLHGSNQPINICNF